MKRIVSVGWKYDVENIRKMRKDLTAPVDTMGCHKLADPLAKPEVHRFQVLVALMLSSQTKDEVNAAAMKRLKDHGLSIETILEIEDEKLRNLLNPVGFYKLRKMTTIENLSNTGQINAIGDESQLIEVLMAEGYLENDVKCHKCGNSMILRTKGETLIRKTEYLKKAAQILKDQYEGDIPNTFDGLCSLPGVGPKMANLVMQIAWQKTTGIAVDVHVHRITNRLGWIKTKTPEQTMNELENLLPKEEWQPINHLLVGFGQMICRPVNPKCEECLLKETCPSSNIGKKKKKSNKVKIEESPD